MATKNKTARQVVVKCPECDEELQLLALFSREYQKIGEQSNCDFCGVVVEILSLNPVVLGGVDEGDGDEDEEFDDEDDDSDDLDFDDEDDDEEDDEDED